MSIQRLDKLISANCLVSRTDAKKLIKDGLVAVNGITAVRPEQQVDTANDVLTVDGTECEIREHIYIMLNKPQGVISASDNPRQETVVDLVPDELRRRNLAPAGRLDKDTTGLIVITDDGDFAHRLISPSHHVYKRYIAELDAPLTQESIAVLERGIALEDGTLCLPAKVKAWEKDGTNFAQIEIREGKYHQVKRMTAACGSHVVALHRAKIGALELDPSLAPGECRELSAKELELLLSD